MTRVKKPGYMGRAVTAWSVLNLALLVVLYVMTYILKDYMDHWIVMAVILIATVTTEWAITVLTVLPIVKEWIDQEEYVNDGEKPSWEKPIDK